MILYYDGSLNGFLCLLGSALKQRLDVTAIGRRQEAGNTDLFQQELFIDSNQDWAARIASGLKARLGDGFMQTLGKAFLSEEDGIEHDLLHLTGRALKEGRETMLNLADPLVNRVDSAAIRCARERHRLLGLLRFIRLADDSYLARCSPRNNIVPLLGAHFAKRLGTQRWLIIDEKRKIGVWGENQQWQIAENIEITIPPNEHQEELPIAELWRSFYRQISNRDRHNPQLRQNFMPKFYWRYLTELQPQTAASETKKPAPEWGQAE